MVQWSGNRRRKNRTKNLSTTVIGGTQPRPEPACSNGPVPAASRSWARRLTTWNYPREQAAWPNGWLGEHYVDPNASAPTVENTASFKPHLHASRPPGKFLGVPLTNVCETAQCLVAACKGMAMVPPVRTDGPGGHAEDGVVHRQEGELEVSRNTRPSGSFAAPLPARLSRARPFGRLGS